MAEQAVSELDKLKSRLEIEGDEQDMKLAVLLEDATDDALGYTNRNETVPGMSSAIRDLAVIRWNEEGNEGESSRSEGSVSRTFEVGIPVKVKEKLSRFRQGQVISRYAP